MIMKDVATYTYYRFENTMSYQDDTGQQQDKC
jgi:hypothetical protein